LPPRPEWEAVLTRATGEDRIARILRDVGELEAAGARVCLLSADAGVPGQLREAIRAARAHFGALHGVVHCAGVPGEGVIQRKNPERAAEVLAPKVLGVAPLLELVGADTPPEELLELLVLFSSSVSVLGGLGESDYCAANTVLDAAAGWAGAGRDSRVVSVAWGPWRHDDWQSTALGGSPRLAELVAAYRAKFGLTDDRGTALLSRIIATPERNVLALGQPLGRAAEFWAGLTDLDALAGVPEPGTAEGPRGYPRPALRTVLVAPRTDLERRITTVWERFLGIDGIGVDDPFFELGGNSLVGTAVVRALRKELALPIAPAVLFEHPTVADLARWAAEAAGAGGGPPDPAQSVSTARGERRRQLRGGRRAAVSGRTDERK
jgi:NAD(P)-dependent dehydrogenase (short-subunit alcohol dehydrogenase family)